MADKNATDKRTPEDGVIIIEAKKIVLAIVAIILIILIITTVVNITTRSNNKESNEEVVDDISDYDTLEGENDGEIEIVESYPCNVSVLADKTQVSTGESITYNLNLENINSDAGILMCSFVLDYDTELFDCEVIVNEENGWVKTAVIGNNITINRRDFSPSFNDQNIAKIVLTVNGEKQEDKILGITDITFTTDENTSFEIPNENVIIPVI